LCLIVSLFLIPTLRVSLPDVLRQNGRVARQLTVGVRQLGDPKASSFSRCCALARYDAHKISGDAHAIIRSLNALGSQQAAW